MDLVLSDDQRSLQLELRRMLEARVTSEARRAGLDRDLWHQLGSMGVFALTLPEADGGVGLGWADAAVVFEELGRAAVPGPVVPTALAAGAIDGAATGDAVVGLVPAGSPALVEHLAELDVLLVDTGTDVVRLPERPSGRPAERPTDPLTPVTVVDPLPVAGDRVLDPQWVRARGSLLVAAVQVGLGQAALDLGVGYAKERVQFGRPIGSFQAVKHLLADAAVALETARAGVHAAAVQLDEGTAGSRAVPAARVVASQAADRACRASIQVHGGIGYTWELDAHLFLKRSMVLDLSIGGVEAAIDDVARSLA